MVQIEKPEKRYMVILGGLAFGTHDHQPDILVIASVTKHFIDTYHSYIGFNDHEVGEYANNAVLSIIEEQALPFIKQRGQGAFKYLSERVSQGEKDTLFSSLHYFRRCTGSGQNNCEDSCKPSPPETREKENRPHTAIQHRGQDSDTHISQERS